MKVKKIANKYSKIISDYLDHKKELKDFYLFEPTLAGIEKSLRLRQFSSQKRVVLSNELKNQYNGFNTSDQTLNNINLIEHTNTFTITTGHQLSLLTGPLFFIYKIISTIKLCKQLKEKFPAYHFVPIYWMASEDHDFDEINHFHLFGKTYRWQTKQTGAVGHFLTDEIKYIFDDLNELVPHFKDAYTKKNNLADATKYIVNELFKNEGLIVLEPNSKPLKALFSSIIVDELINQNSHKEIEKASEKLNNLGYSNQVTPREINLFYCSENLRERIVYENNSYKVLHTKLSFSKDEIIKLVKESPEKFSPNVALRPVYQEVILPNLAYIGGPGELAYWLQLKSNFNRLEVFFPVLILRDSFMILSKSNQKIIQKLNLELSDVFTDVQLLKKQLVKKWSDNELHLNDEITQIEKIIYSIKNKTNDKSLYPAIEAEFAKINKSLINLEKRIHKAEEQKHEIALKQLEKLNEKLFPEGIPQERYENVLNYLINDENFIEKVYKHADVLDSHLKILLQE